jgi:hypothetical protein
MIFRVFASFATHRPPGDHETSFVIVDARDETEAQLIAAQIVGSHSVMPTRTKIHRG